MLKFPRYDASLPSQPGHDGGLVSRRNFLAATLAGWVSLVALKAPAWADSAEDEALFGRQRVAVADMRLASEWMAHSYEITERVPQEMLIHGHSYADTLIALALMAKGASLNELMELRAYHRWEIIARKVELDPQTLAPAVRQLLTRAVNQDPLPYEPCDDRDRRKLVLHYLPDVYVGQARDLSFNAFTPIVPTTSLVERFRLNSYEVRNIRRALEDPLGVPEDLLLQTGGRGGLIVGDWVVAGVLTHHKPLSIDTVLSARAGERLSWSETCMAFGMRPDVLTRGPLAGVYPIMTGSAPGTILVARRRSQFPELLPASYDLRHLGKDEVQALFPLLARCYRLSAQEQDLLSQNKSELAEKGLIAALSRLAKVDLVTILDLRRAGNSYRNIVARYALDLTGQDGVKAVIDVREPRGESS